MIRHELNILLYDVVKCIHLVYFILAQIANKEKFLRILSNITLLSSHQCESDSGTGYVSEKPIKMGQDFVGRLRT